MTLRYAYSFAFASFIMLTGCQNTEHQDIKKWMDDQAKNMQPNVPPLPEIKPFPVVDYEPGDLTDPFNSIRIKKQATKTPGGAIDRGGRREPLESYPLETIEMVGVIQQGSNFTGLVKAGDQVHKVKIGNFMGQNFGVITSIDANSIKLKELIQDQVGWTERVSTLQLVTEGVKK